MLGQFRLDALVVARIGEFRRREHEEGAAISGHRLGSRDGRLKERGQKPQRGGDYASHS
jgi:hypothetical protein